MHRALFLLIAAVAVSLPAGSRAEVLTYEFSAVVTRLQSSTPPMCPRGCFGLPNYEIGETVTGSFSYDTDFAFIDLLTPKSEVIQPAIHLVIDGLTPPLRGTQPAIFFGKSITSGKTRLIVASNYITFTLNDWNPETITPAPHSPDLADFNESSLRLSEVDEDRTEYIGIAIARLTSLTLVPTLCPGDRSGSRLDSDGDGLGDACDMCPFDADNDVDMDGFCGDVDNCPFDPNTTQEDADEDELGDACDPDVDGDGVQNQFDYCPATPRGALVDSIGCSVADLCPCDGSFDRHGAYVRCVEQVTAGFSAEGLITARERGLLVSGAAGSSCGQQP